MTLTEPPPPDTFQHMISALTKPSAFPEDADALPGSIISVIQTHASAVLLTNARAYKLKKPVNPGFLDYSTAERRRTFCIEECAVNEALAPGVYLGVAPVLTSADGSLRFGATMAIDQAPEIGVFIQNQRVSDFAVVMRRLPEERTLASLVRSGMVNTDLIRQIAGVTAEFHRQIGSAHPQAQNGSLADALANITQTLKQAEADINVTVSEIAYRTIHRFVLGFIERRHALLESRFRDGWARDGHGDLRTEHVYAMPRNGNNSEMDVLIVDRIEFDPRFRYGDVASEVAFLAVELECVGRADLARAYINNYVEAMGDRGLLEVLPFYKVYRALVRGHVRSILLAEPGLDAQTRANVRSEATAMYVLATQHANAPTVPYVAIVGGLMGSGKSTLAEELRKELGWPVISSDVLRKRLAGLPLTEPASAADQRGIYTSDWDERVYGEMIQKARLLLEDGHSVILDATFSRRERREKVALLAHSTNARAIFLECVCPRDIAMSRLETRWQAKLRHQSVNEHEEDVTLASDGRPALYDQQAQRWEAYDTSAEAGLAHAQIMTAASRSKIIEQALAALDIPRLACWLK